MEIFWTHILVAVFGLLMGLSIGMPANKLKNIPTGFLEGELIRRRYEDKVKIAAKKEAINEVEELGK